jgi:iron complex transport system ATP-binding protein
MVIPLLEAREISLAVKSGKQRRWILQSVNRRLDDGEFVGLIGPNGAGKSSLLRLLSGFSVAQAGSVWLLGQLLAGYSSRDRAKLIAAITQESPTELPYTVREIVTMGRYAHQRALTNLSNRDAQAINAAIARVGLEAQADQFYDTLSGGEKQLTMFARVLAQDTRMLLLDEPAAGLDLSHEHQLCAMLQELSRQGRGVLMALHHLDVAAEYCNRLVLVSGGQVVAEGLPETVLSKTNLARYFTTTVHIGRNEATGSVTVQHVAPKRAPSGPRLHLFGGIGSAVLPTRLLVNLGYRLSGGVAHEFDADARLWQHLDLPRVLTPAFSLIDDQAFAAASVLIQEAEVCLWCDPPLGFANRRNLDLAATAKRLIVVRVDIQKKPKIDAIDLEVAYQKLLDRAQIVSLAALPAVILSELQFIPTQS